MKEVFTMWRHTNMIVLVALSAAMYAALLIPFQSIPIIPGHVSLRVADILPVAFGMLFGPAGAWGVAIGNLIGDFFGTLSPGAIGGFVAGFMNAFLSYKLWNALSPLRDMGLKLNSGPRMLRYQVSQLIRQCGITVVLTFWVALTLGLAPAEFYFVAVLIPGAITAGLITPVILRIIYPRIRKWGLLWTDIMEPEEVSAGRFRKVGFALTTVGALGGVASLIIAMFVLGIPSGDIVVRLLPIPFLVLLFGGSVLMGGREQVMAMEQEREDDMNARRRRSKRAGFPPPDDLPNESASTTS
ncbi:QueT transporter family protein [Brachybacterium vulturis]|uniref:QueT transporter family protein n=1 Tax=Brachybacterium vulturis TaxID=2017484 RepID=UPI0037360D6B